MTPTTEQAAEMRVIIQTRLGVLCGDGPANAGAYEIAQREAEEWLQAQQAHEATEHPECPR